MLILGAEYSNFSLNEESTMHQHNIISRHPTLQIPDSMEFSFTHEMTKDPVAETLIEGLRYYIRQAEKIIIEGNKIGHTVTTLGGTLDRQDILNNKISDLRLEDLQFQMQEIEQKFLKVKAKLDELKQEKA